MIDISPSSLYLTTAICLMLAGLSGVLLRRNMLKMALGFSLLETGTHLLIATLGSNPARTAPILYKSSLFRDLSTYLGDAKLVVDPVPQALVLTAIVIGVGTSALLLAYVVRLYALRQSLDVRDFGGLKC
jgi:multicomponent Na+:H+ antiporter subunit C